MWAGIACMSVCLPFSNDIKPRAVKRGLFNIVGCLLFLVLYYILPSSMYPYIGIIGGIGVGYSAGYAWQTAVILRISANIFSSAYTFISDKILSRMLARF